MKYKLFKFCVISCAILLSSCGEDPEPLPQTDFVVERVRAEYEDAFVFDVNDEIQFNNLTTNAVKFEWDFGDGIKSSEASPKHKYLNSGRYSVTLLAYNNNGDQTEHVEKLFIRRRHLKNICILSSKIQLPNNLIIFFGETNNTEKFFIYALPTSYCIPDGVLLSTDLVRFNGNNWFFMLIENLAPYESFGSNDRLIFSSIFNPAVINPIDYSGTSGSYTISETKNFSGEITNDFTFKIDFSIYDY